MREKLAKVVKLNEIDLYNFNKKTYDQHALFEKVIDSFAIPFFVRHICSNDFDLDEAGLTTVINRNRRVCVEKENWLRFIELDREYEIQKQFFPFADLRDLPRGPELSARGIRKMGEIVRLN